MSNKTLQSLFHYKRWADGELLTPSLPWMPCKMARPTTALRIFNHIHVVDAIFKANLLGNGTALPPPIPRRRRPWRCCAAPSASWMPGIWITLPA